jgi:predicted permease
MSQADVRVEKDSLGDVPVPADKLWGAQTQRSLEHFSIGKDLIPREMITSYAILKKGAANANQAGRRLDEQRHKLIVQVYDEILAGQHHDMFPLHVWMTGSGTQFKILSGLKSGLKSPLLWGPVLGFAVVLSGRHIPRDIASCFGMIGSATSRVAVFTLGLTLAAHAFHLSKAVVLATFGRITVQTAILFALLHRLHLQSPFAREALVCCSFPLATIVVLLAAKYKAMEAESASALLLSTLSLVVTVPVIIAISG